MKLYKTSYKAVLCLALLLWGAGIGCVKAQSYYEPYDTSKQDSIAQPTAPTIAVFSYETAFNSIAELSIVKAEVENLKKQYDDELKKAEAEFNKKYEEFLEQQTKLAAAIRYKRQAEIQQLLESNLAFKAEAQKQIKAKEAELIAPIKSKLQSAINRVATEGGYSIVLNTDNNACPFIDDVKVTDVTQKIIDVLK